MKTACLSLVATCLAGPALALSCLAPDVMRSYAEAAASEKEYVVVHGTLSFDEAQLPPEDLLQNDKPPETDIPARLSGTYLTEAGFEETFDRPVTLRALCLGPWCGRPASGSDYLAFLEKAGDGFLLEINPCGGFEFADPDTAMLDKVAQCFRTGDCEAEPQ